jgi:hypothetical protein
VSRGRGKVVLGLRTHSGWAALVALAGDARAPVVVERRRIEMADVRLAGSVQPYHEAEGLPLARAERLLARLLASARTMALRDLGALVRALRDQGHTPRTAAILCGAGRLGSTLAHTLASHAMIHTADGEHFRDALAHACKELDVRVVRVPEREVAELASSVLGHPPEEMRRRVQEMGKALGPPWTADHKSASLAAWALLAEGR